jgi:hypothetical protein
LLTNREKAQDHPSGAEQAAEKGHFSVEFGGTGTGAKALPIILNKLWHD